jgi:hypothetical protein
MFNQKEGKHILNFSGNRAKHGSVTPAAPLLQNSSLTIKGSILNEI